MDAALYLLFSVLDCFAIIGLMYKTFRWPFWKSFWRILLISSMLAVISYVDRVVLGLAAYDVAIQLVFYILFFRYILKISFFYAFPLAAIGYLEFNIIQFVTYPTLLSLGVVTGADAVSNAGLGIYLIQICTEIVSYTVATLFWIFGRGFSYIDVPPHTGDESIRRSKCDICVNIVGTIVVIIPMYLVLNYQSEHIYFILASSIIALIMMFYLSRRKDEL